MSKYHIISMPKIAVSAFRYWTCFGDLVRLIYRSVPAFWRGRKRREKGTVKEEKGKRHKKREEEKGGISIGGMQKCRRRGRGRRNDQSRKKCRREEEA